MLYSRRIKALEAQVKSLSNELAEAKRTEVRSAFISAAMLPPCRDYTCLNCEYIVYAKHRDHAFVVGCGKDRACPDFKECTNPETTTARRLQPSDLQRQVQW